MSKRERWSVYAGTRESQGYVHLYLHFSRGYKVSARAELAQEAQYRSDLDYFEAKVRNLHEKTGSDVYFNRSHRQSFELRFQANTSAPNAFGELTELSDWYGPRLGNAELSPAVGRAIAKFGAEYNLTPAKAIELLRAIPVRYVDFGSTGGGEYVPAADFAIPLAPGAEQQSA